MKETPLTLTRAQVRRVDAIAIERFGIPGIVLMENAARGAAEMAWRMLGRRTEATALILAGGGNNGGDGLAIARHLHNRGVRVVIGLCTDPQRYQGDALINWNIVKSMDLPTFDASPEAIARQSRPNLLIDAIFGTGLDQPPRPPFAERVHAVETLAAPMLAVDIPSGLDCDSGEPIGEMAIRATQTATFVARKAGFGRRGARAYTGRITVIDIGAPPQAITMASKS